MHTTLLAAFLLAAARLWAGVALLAGEPFGKFGAFSPTGHAAIYLSGVCAESPTWLRLCGPGEDGVVISRYNGIAGYDWVAVPLVPYLYAVERPGEVPASADPRTVAVLRDLYRRAHLRELAPDGPEGETPGGSWNQLVGASYDRNIYGFALDTSTADDARLIEWLNARPNRRRFNLLYRNCADFARSIVNFYYPGAVRRNMIADLGISTPKQSARALTAYCRRRPALRLSRFVIPQIPGSRRSTRLRGVAESLVRSKKYAAPLVVLEPWAVVSAGFAYVIWGRFDPARPCHAVCRPDSLEACIDSRDYAVFAGKSCTSAQAESGL